MLHLQAYLVGDPFAVGTGRTDRSGKLTASRILDAVPPPPASIGGRKQAAAACALTAEMRWSPSAVVRPSKMPYDTGKGHRPRRSLITFCRRIHNAAIRSSHL